MNKLYAPWRRFYAHKIEWQKDEQSDRPCVFCALSTDSNRDEENFVLKRFEHTIALLNLYPYNGGHVLVAPYLHVDLLDKLSRQARCELIEVANETISILQKEFEPDGFNLGMNIGGKAAGGSIPEHLHMHVLPRWHGDTSFLPTLADTKPISEDLRALYTQLKKAFAAPCLQTNGPKGVT